MDLGTFIPSRRPSPRQRINEIFSRDVLGSVLVGLAGGKIVEQAVVLAAPGRPRRLVAWAVAFGLFVVLFAYWEHVERRVQEVAAGESDSEE